MNRSKSVETVVEPSLPFDFSHLVDDARGVRLGVALIGVAWVHLALFTVCEVLFVRGDRAAAHFLPLWTLDVVSALLLVRGRINSLGCLGSTRSTRLILRIWLTFAILCFTSASLNSLTGFQIDWFKISWSMLGTFGFATLAWVFHLGFLIPAVLMSLTALLIASHPDHAYLIFGLAWFVTLHGFGFMLDGKRLMQRFGLDQRRDERIVIKHRSEGLQS